LHGWGVGHTRIGWRRLPKPYQENFPKFTISPSANSSSVNGRSFFAHRTAESLYTHTRDLLFFATVPLCCFAYLPWNETHRLGLSTCVICAPDPGPWFNSWRRFKSGCLHNQVTGGTLVAAHSLFGRHMGGPPQASSHFYYFGPFCLDAFRLLLYNNGQPVTVAPRFVRALLLLVQNHGMDLDKDYLMSQLWPDTTVEENNLTVIICALRKTLAENPEQHKYILTVPGRGYRFVAEVKETWNQPLLLPTKSTEPAEAAPSPTEPA